MNPIPKLFGNPIYKLFFDREWLLAKLGAWFIMQWAKQQAATDGDAVSVDEILHEWKVKLDAWMVDHGYML